MTEKTPAAKTAGVLFPAGVALLTLLVFLPSLTCGFADRADSVNLLFNEHFRGFAPANLRWMWTTTWKGPYMPLTWMSFALDYELWGLDPFGFHLTNILLHALAAALACLLAKRLLGSWWIAAWAALLFALHPLRVDSVTWVSERRDMLAGIFTLGTVLYYLKGRPRAAAALYVVSLLCKSIGMLLPAVLLAMDTLLLGRLPLDIRRWTAPEYDKVLREKYPFAAAALLAAWITLAGHTGAGSPVHTSPFPGAGVLLAARNVCFYLWKMLWPDPLVPIYELPRPFLPGSVVLWSSVAAVAGITAMAWGRRRSQPALLAAWISFVALLLPVLGLVTFARHVAADRYTYMAGLPLALLAGAGLARLLEGPEERRAGCRIAAVLVLGALAAATARQQRTWKDPVTQWTRAGAADPDCAMCRLNLCSAYARIGEMGGAREACEEAVLADPALAPAHLYYGQLLLRLGEKQRARQELQRARDLDPESIEVQAIVPSALEETK